MGVRNLLLRLRFWEASSVYDYQAGVSEAGGGVAARGSAMGGAEIADPRHRDRCADVQLPGSSAGRGHRVDAGSGPQLCRGLVGSRRAQGGGERGGPRPTPAVAADRFDEPLPRGPQPVQRGQDQAGGVQLQLPRRLHRRGDRTRIRDGRRHGRRCSYGVNHTELHQAGGFLRPEGRHEGGRAQPLARRTQRVRPPRRLRDGDERNVKRRNQSRYRPFLGGRLRPGGVHPEASRADRLPARQGQEKGQRPEHALR